MDKTEKVETIEVASINEVAETKIIPREAIIENAAEIIKKPVICITDKAEDEIAPSVDKDPRHFVTSTSYKMWLDKDGNLSWEDGVANPNAERYKDKERLGYAKYALFYTTEAAIESKNNNEDSEDYTNYARQILSKWFIDEETRMIPNLEFSQMVEGRNTGSYFGIIDGHDLLFFLDMTDKLKENGLIDGTKNEKDRDLLAGVAKWYEEYLKWLTESPKGIGRVDEHGHVTEKGEIEMKNNHGTCYDLQVARIADYLGHGELVGQALDRAKSRIDSQITESGEMPEERKRPGIYSYRYQLYNLYLFSDLARIGEKYNKDLWHYGNLDKAFGYFNKQLSDYYEEKGTTLLQTERSGEMFLTFRSASAAYRNQEYFDNPKKYFPNDLLSDKLTKDLYSIER